MQMNETRRDQTEGTLEQIITRFAPSPTGYLHIGGARTALFNFLYAKAKGGRMLLRIEDTDQTRSTIDAKRAILEGLTWLGLSWEGEPVFQSERVARHQEIVQQLLDSGAAYRCFATAQELEAMRLTAQKEKRAPRYDRRWRERAVVEHPESVPFVVRIKAPLEGATVLEDQVQGRVVFPNKDLDDFVIARSDGTPTYMLAVVVDDHDMGITHIIRGDDHLTNAARQILLYNALGWKVPIMAHIPLIHGADGTKLSKRHGALGVDAYRAMGFLPSALRNYLVRLGWSHGDDELMSDAQMQEWFDLSGIGKSAARFDFAKLTHLNGLHLRTTPPEEIVRAFKDFLACSEKGQEILALWSPELEQKFIRALGPLVQRARTLEALREGAAFLWETRPLTLESAATKILTPEAHGTLRNLLPVLASVERWDVPAIETAVQAHLVQTQTLLKEIAQPLRAALTGRTTSPGIFDVLVLLGREESLGRIEDAAKE